MKKKRKHQVKRGTTRLPDSFASSRPMTIAVLGEVKSKRIAIDPGIAALLAALMTTVASVAMAMIPRNDTTRVSGVSSQAAAVSALKEFGARQIVVELKAREAEARKFRDDLKRAPLSQNQKEERLNEVDQYLDKNAAAQAAIRTIHPQVLTAVKAADPVTTQLLGTQINSSLSQEGAPYVLLRSHFGPQYPERPRDILAYSLDSFRAGRRTLPDTNQDALQDALSANQTRVLSDMLSQLNRDESPKSDEQNVERQTQSPTLEEDEPWEVRALVTPTHFLARL